MKSHIKRIQIWILILLQSGICQDLVFEGVVGKSVLLPCSSSQSSDVEVFWRDKNSRVLLDIKQGQPHLEFQDQRYKDRVTSFPEEFKNKNYSITLGTLKVEDTGNYECSVLFNSIITKTKISLTVKDVRNSASCVSSRRIVLQMLVLSALTLIF